MSLHALVQGSFPGRLSLRRRIPARSVVTTTALPRITISSMRVLETGLALTAIATALLIGVGR